MAIEFTVNPVVTAATQQTTTGTPVPVQQPSAQQDVLRQDGAQAGKGLPQKGGTDSPNAKKHAAQAPSDVNHYAQSLQRRIEFAVDPVTGGLVVKVIDSTTGEVIREIPADEVPYLVRHLAEMQGQLLDAKA